MEELLEDEVSSSSEDEEDSRKYEEMCVQMIKMRQRLKKNHHYVLHDEMELNAVDREDGPQTLYLDIDIRMSNTWDKVGKEATTAPFEIIYQFDGMRTNRVLHTIETGQRIIKENRWTKVNEEQPQKEVQNESEEAEQMPLASKTMQPPEETEGVTEEKDAARESTEEARRRQMQALENSIQLELQKEPLLDTEKQYVEHLKQMGSVLRDLLGKKDNNDTERKTDMVTIEGSSSVKRSSRRPRRALSYREQSSDDSLEEETSSIRASEIISDKKIKKRLKVTLQRIRIPLESEATIAGFVNSLSPILAGKELEGVMQPSLLQVMSKQLLEDDSAGGESGKVGD